MFTFDWKELTTALLVIGKFFEIHRLLTVITFGNAFLTVKFNVAIHISTRLFLTTSWTRDVHLNMSSTNDLDTYRLNEFNK